MFGLNCRRFCMVGFRGRERETSAIVLVHLFGLDCRRCGTAGLRGGGKETPATGQRIYLAQG
jgi:hypothetical protein